MTLHPIITKQNNYNWKHAIRNTGKYKNIEENMQQELQKEHKKYPNDRVWLFCLDNQKTIYIKRYLTRNFSLKIHKNI